MSPLFRRLALAGLGCLLLAGLRGAGAAGSGAAAARQEEGAGRIRLHRDRLTGEFGLEADEAPLERIADLLGRACGAAVEIEAPLRERRLTARLPARPPERLFLVLARRADARLSIAFRLSRDPSPGGVGPGPRLFAREPVPATPTGAVTLTQALSLLAAPVEPDEGLEGEVRLPATGRPLAQVLDRLAAQLQVRWWPVVRFQTRSAADEAAAAQERRDAHLTELARLPRRERQEEIRADLESIENLPDGDRDAAVNRLCGDVLSLADYLAEMPGEHRASAATRVLAVASDYRFVLAAGRRSPWQAPLRAAMVELGIRLEAIR